MRERLRRMALPKHPWYFETQQPEHALEGRGLLGRYLSEHCEGDLYGAQLVYGELLSNVVKHAPRGGVRVWLERVNDRYALCIKDSGHGFDTRLLKKKPDDLAESGRGLFIIRQICRRISCRRLRRGGFVVRAELPISTRAGSPA